MTRTELAEQLRERFRKLHSHHAPEVVRRMEEASDEKLITGHTQCFVCGGRLIEDAEHAALIERCAHRDEYAQAIERFAREKHPRCVPLLIAATERLNEAVSKERPS